MATPDQEQLDLYSERFDPLAALYAPEVALPDPQARPLDNVYKCRQLLPPDHPEAMVFDPPGTKQVRRGEVGGWAGCTARMRIAGALGGALGRLGGCHLLAGCPRTPTHAGTSHHASPPHLRPRRTHKRNSTKPGQRMSFSGSSAKSE